MGKSSGILTPIVPSLQRRGGCADSQRAGGADGVVSSTGMFAELTTRQFLLSCRATPPLRGGELLAYTTFHTPPLFPLPHGLFGFFFNGLAARDFTFIVDFPSLRQSNLTFE